MSKPSKQLHGLHECKIETAWSRGLFQSNMYPANTTLKWLDTDTPENAQYQKDITYTFNEHGFRSDSFYSDARVGMLTSGCSLTVGVGVDQHETWPYLLRDMIQDFVGEKFAVWNVATSGASPDYVSRSVYKLDKSLPTFMVFVVWPSEVRFEMPSSSDETMLTQARAYEDDFPRRLVNTDWLDYNLMRNVAFLDERYHRKQKKFASNVFNQYRPTVEEKIKLDRAFVADTLARDGQHPGPDWHRRVAEYYFDFVLDNKDTILARYRDYIKQFYDK